jgi:2-oxoglutarate ferredoxin oxidoreductase subunit delta
MAANEPTKKIKPHRVNIYKSWCKHCGICTAFCPKGALQRDAEGFPYVADPTLCIGCRLCELRCPDFAIEVQDIEKPDKKDSSS